MSSSPMFREIELQLSADLVRQCPGLSMDVGGSVAKIVYRHNEDWKKMQADKDATTGKLRLLSCVRTDLDEAIVKLKKDCHITANSDGKPTEIFTCGVGCSQFGVRINRELNVRLSNVMELDCFIKSFQYLVDRYPASTLLHPPCQEEMDAIAEEEKQMVVEMRKFQDMSATKMSVAKPDDGDGPKKDGVDLSGSEPLAKAIGDDMYPCVLAMLGSAFGVMRINKDGSFEIPDGSNRGGRTLLGLASLICGTNSYDEIIDLAEKGNQFNVSMSQKAFAKDMATPEEEAQTQDVYAAMMDSPDMREMLVFAFGHAVGKKISDFRREDLAAALLILSLNDTVHLIIQAAHAIGAKHVFISGSYANRQYVKQLFTKEWGMANMNAKIVYNKPDVSLHFLEHGSHLGALGALINNTEKFFTREGKINK